MPVVRTVDRIEAATAAFKAYAEAVARRDVQESVILKGDLLSLGFVVGVRRDRPGRPDQLPPLRRLTPAE